VCPADKKQVYHKKVTGAIAEANGSSQRANVGNFSRNLGV